MTAEICVRAGYGTRKDEENDKVRSIQIFRMSSVTVCEYRRGPSGAVTVWTAALPIRPVPVPVVISALAPHRPGDDTASLEKLSFFVPDHF